jgi:ketosteroid isomerase-like protein
MSHADVSRSLMRAFQEQDADLARSLLAPDFTFTSPQDDHLDVAEWFEKCFPTAGHFTGHDLTDVVESGETVLLRYEYTIDDGTTWANAERHVIRGGKIADVQVYFGGKLG